MKRIHSYIKLLGFVFAICFATENLCAQVEFIENKGQWDPKVKFMSSAGSGSFFLTDKGFTVAQYNADDVENIKIRMHEEHYSGTVNRQIKKDSIRTDSYSVQFLNAQDPVIVPDKIVPSVNNYFIGNDPSKWASGCKIYLGVTYKNIYPNIDLRYYTDAAGNLKYDFIVNPGARIDDIAMKYTGHKKISVKNRELHIATSLGVNKEMKPYTYQVINNQKTELDCRYEVKGDVVRF
ncbi:MAG TPA: hypothetical protein VFF23_01275, partial [Hanamia sp.]|nr:hypothetical protein [Hanamia sp.]